MAATVTYSAQELRAMSPAELDEAARALVQGARRTPTAEEIKEIEDQLRTFEVHQGCSTGEMRARVRDGSLREDERVCHWLIMADLLDKLRSMRAGAGRTDP